MIKRINKNLDHLLPFNINHNDMMSYTQYRD